MKEINFEIFRERLTALKESRGLTNAELGDYTNISSGALSRYMTGSRKPEIDSALSIANFFGVQLEWLFGLTDEKYKEIPKAQMELINLYNKASVDDKIVIQTILKKYV